MKLLKAQFHVKGKKILKKKSKWIIGSRDHYNVEGKEKFAIHKASLMSNLSGLKPSPRQQVMMHFKFDYDPHTRSPSNESLQGKALHLNRSIASHPNAISLTICHVRCVTIIYTDQSCNCDEKYPLILCTIFYEFPIINLSMWTSTWPTICVVCSEAKKSLKAEIALSCHISKRRKRTQQNHPT